MFGKMGLHVVCNNDISGGFLCAPSNDYLLIAILIFYILYFYGNILSYGTSFIQYLTNLMSNCPVQYFLLVCMGYRGVCSNDL